MKKSIKSNETELYRLKCTHLKRKRVPIYDTTRQLYLYKYMYVTNTRKFFFSNKIKFEQLNIARHKTALKHKQKENKIAAFFHLFQRRRKKRTKTNGWKNDNAFCAWSVCCCSYDDRKNFP